MSAKSSSTENGIDCQKLIKDANEEVLKRAQYEAFEFELEAPGLIRVSNGSHENPEEHSYLVNVETDTPVACECKALQYQEGPCKHIVAVGIREPVLKAAQSRQKPSPIPDGGKTWIPVRTVRKAAVAHRETTCPVSTATTREDDELNSHHKNRNAFASKLRYSLYGLRQTEMVTKRLAS